MDGSRISIAHILHYHKKDATLSPCPVITGKASDAPRKGTEESRLLLSGSLPPPSPAKPAERSGYLLIAKLQKKYARFGLNNPTAYLSHFIAGKASGKMSGAPCSKQSGNKNGVCD